LDPTTATTTTTTTHDSSSPRGDSYLRGDSFLRAEAGLNRNLATKCDQCNSCECNDNCDCIGELLTDNAWIYIRSNHPDHNDLYLEDSNSNLKFWFERTKFFVKASGRGGYVMETNGKCADNNFSNGDAFMHPCHGGNNQIWHFYGNSWSDVEIKSENAQECLDLKLDSSWNDWDAIMWSCNGQSNQRFEVTLA
jgi:hypothetical protein